MDSQTASCFDCRYPLDGLDSRACPECGRPFDPDDVGTFNRILGDPVELTRQGLTEAVILRLRLEHEGIPVAMQQQTGGVVMYAPVPMAALYVNRSDKEDAQIVMDAHALDVQTEEPGQPWTCPNCGEEIDGEFDLCWNCGAERPA